MSAGEARHLGFKRTPHSRVRRFGALHPVFRAKPYPDEASLEELAPEAFDQGASETCVDHMAATLIVVACAAAGEPVGFVPSPLAIARNAYCEDQPGEGPLEDTGIDLANVATALAREGIRPIGPLAPGRFSDVTPELVRVRPTLAEDLVSAQHLVLGPEPLDPGAADFLDQVATGIANLRCGAALGIHATPSFQSWRAGMAPISDTRGATDSDGHGVACLAYRTEIDRSLSFLLRSSWSRSYGANGSAWVTGEWLRSMCLEAWRFRAALKGARA